MPRLTVCPISACCQPPPSIYPDRWPQSRLLLRFPWTSGHVTWKGCCSIAWGLRLFFSKVGDPGGLGLSSTPEGFSSILQHKFGIFWGAIKLEPPKCGLWVGGPPPLGPKRPVLRVSLSRWARQIGLIQALKQWSASEARRHLTTQFATEGRWALPSSSSAVQKLDGLPSPRFGSFQEVVVKCAHFFIITGTPPPCLRPLICHQPGPAREANQAHQSGRLCLQNGK